MKSWADFLNKLSRLREERKSNIALFLNPRLENLPLSIARFDDPFFPYGKEIIRMSQDLVVTYVFDLASYLALGAAGAVALERTIRFAGDSLTILHAPFAHEGYSVMADITGFGVDAITVTSSSLLKPYLEKAPFAAFSTETDDIPAEGGLFLERELSYLDAVGQAQSLRLTDDKLLFASKREDYLDVLRQGLETMR